MFIKLSIAAIFVGLYFNFYYLFKSYVDKYMLFVVFNT